MKKEEKSFPIDTFGGRLQQLRKEHDYTRAQFWNKVFDSKDSEDNDIEAGKAKTVRNWESGKVEPRAETLRKICKALNCDAEYLWGEQKNKSRLVDTIKGAIGFSEEFIEQLILERQEITSSIPKSYPDFIFEILSSERELAKLDARQKAIECLYNEPGLLEAINDYTGINDSELDQKLFALSRFLDKYDVDILRQYKNRVYKDEIEDKLNSMKLKLNKTTNISDEGTPSGKLSVWRLKDLFDKMIDVCEKKEIAEEYERKKQAQDDDYSTEPSPQFSIFDSVYPE